MLRYSTPPDEPNNFSGHVKTARDKIDEIIRNNTIPASADFDDSWKSFKGALFRSQHQKCGYCELFLGTHPGDVEHYRPKAELQELSDDETSWGEEDKDVFNVVGRRPVKVSDSGYWWAAYSWQNYLAAFNRCNSGWKRNLFPIKEKPRKAPAQGNQEIELLLNPFYGEDPADHLEFDKLGQVKALNNSEFGRATILTCGLDRNSLVVARNEKVTRAYELVRNYERAKTTEKRTEVLNDFFKMGLETYEFAGMVRAIFKQKLKLPWQEWKEVLQVEDE
jgi:hypothetical protein